MPAVATPPVQTRPDAPSLSPPHRPANRSFPAPHELFRLSPEAYDRMIAARILTEDDPVELLEGFLVLKMPHNPPHDGTIQLANKRIGKKLPPGWDVRVQSTIRLVDSTPEPDLAVVRGDEMTYVRRHPTA